MMEERWLPVVGFEGFYEVSDQGRVRTVERLVPNKWKSLTLRRVRQLSLFCDKDGYRRVSLWRDGAMRQRPVHQLVLEAFVGGCPDGHMTLHADGTRSNNVLGNLSWGTALQNAEDRSRHGRTSFAGARNPKAKLTPEKVVAIRCDSRSVLEIASAFGVDKKTVHEVQGRRTWAMVA